MPYTAIVPNHAAFGTEQDAYLKALQANTGDPTANAVNQITLMMQAQKGGGDYMQALREANQFQHQGQQTEIQGDVAKTYLTGAGPMAKEGISGAVMPADNPYLRIAPNRLNQADAIHLQGVQADAVKNTGEGVKNLAEAGFAPDAKYVGGMITPPLQEEPAPVSNYMSPGNKAKLEEAAAAREQASAATYRAVHNHEGANADKTVTTYISDGKGGFVPIGQAVTSKGAPGQVPIAAAPAGGGGKGHLERDPKTNQLHWVPAAK